MLFNKLNIIRLAIQGIAILWMVLIILLALHVIEESWWHAFSSWKFIVFCISSFLLSMVIGDFEIEFVDIDEDGNVVGDNNT